MYPRAAVRGPGGIPISSLSKMGLRAAVYYGRLAYSADQLPLAPDRRAGGMLIRPNIKEPFGSLASFPFPGRRSVYLVLGRA